MSFDRDLNSGVKSRFVIGGLKENGMMHSVGGRCTPVSIAIIAIVLISGAGLLHADVISSVDVKSADCVGGVQCNQMGNCPGATSCTAVDQQCGQYKLAKNVKACKGGYSSTCVQETNSPEVLCYTDAICRCKKDTGGIYFCDPTTTELTTGQSTTPTTCYRK